MGSAGWLWGGVRPPSLLASPGLGAVSPGAPSAGWVGVAPRCRAGRVSRVGWLYGRRALADLRWPFQRKGIQFGVAILRDGLNRLSQHPLVGEARGLGLMGGIELVADKRAKRAFDPKLGVATQCVGLDGQHPQVFS